MEIVPTKIKPDRMARLGRSITGNLPLMSLARLNQLHRQNSDGIAIVNFSFEHDKRGNCVINGSFKANIGLDCQRCLDDLELNLEHEFLLLVEKTDKKLKNAQNYDIVSQDGEHIALHDMIEDEILLSLADFPKHADQNCLGNIRD